MDDTFVSVRNILVASGIAGILILIGVVAYYHWHFSGDVFYEHDKWGQLGDFFGGILNPIYSLLAYLGLLTTVALTYKANAIIHAENTRQRQVDKRDEAYKIISNVGNKIDNYLERCIKYPDPSNSFKYKTVVFNELLISSYSDDEGWQAAENNLVFLNKLSAMFEFFTVCLCKYNSIDSSKHIPRYYKSLYKDAVDFLYKYHKVPEEVVDFFKEDAA